MKITKNTVVVMTYTLKVDGEIADQAPVEMPFDYIQGANMILPKLEEAVEGLEPGAEYSAVISAADGYGEYDEKLCFDIPKSSFAIGGKIREDLLVVGNIVPMLDMQGGVVRARIVEIKEKDVKVDFNDIMAGKDLDFSGKILSVREATEKELTEGLHGEFLPKEHCCHGHCKNKGGEGHECHCHDESDGHECNCHDESDGHECNCNGGSDSHECRCHDGEGGDCDCK